MDKFKNAAALVDDKELASDICDLASQMLAAMEQRTRDEGSVFWVRKDGAPEWMATVCHVAHGDMLPDDWRYEFIVSALSALAEGDDEGETIEPDVYTSDLTGWLHSRTDRHSYTDQAVEEGYDFTDTMTLLSLGQLTERQEVFRLVKERLEALADKA